MRAHHPFFMLLWALLAAGCYGYSTAAISTPLEADVMYKPVPGDSVRVLFGPTSMADSEYVQIALIEVIGSSGESTTGLVRKLRTRAGKIGATMVINSVVSQQIESRGNLLIDIHALTDGDAKTGPSDDKYVAPIMRGVAIRQR